MQTEGERMTAAWDALLLTLGGPPVERQPLLDDDKSKRVTRTPVTVLSGFLGAGKTTLLCELLEHSSAEVVAIVNDIASINVDAALVRAKNTETIELENGCACCVLGTDLRETLHELGARARPPDAIVIEASGISDPVGIAQTVANSETTALDGIVTVIDAQTFQQRASDPLTGALFERQLSAAHLIVLTKTAVKPMHSDEVSALQEAIGQLAPGRSVLVSDQVFAEREAYVEILLGAATRGARPALSSADHDYDGFAVETLSWLEPVYAPAFFELLDSLGDSIFRMKGRMHLQDAGVAAWFEVQAAGAHWRVEGCVEPAGGSQLVVIGRANDTAFDAFVQALRQLSYKRQPA